MFVGVPNPNLLMPLAKMTIKNMDSGKSFQVLYNPQSYQQSRTVEYSQIPVMGTNAPKAQFNHGSGEALKLQLFFDSLSAGGEVGGTPVDKLKFAANSMLSSAGNTIDIREYTQKVYDLMLIPESGNRDAPPRLLLTWGSLVFVGYLVSCTQTFTRFDEVGMPVRATLDCEFREYAEDNRADVALELANLKAKNATYRVAGLGATLSAIAALEYGDAQEWRGIADANGISNPRSLRTGDAMVIPGG